jgi:hypothetical protein
MKIAHHVFLQSLWIYHAPKLGVGKREWGAVDSLRVWKLSTGRKNGN